MTDLVVVVADKDIEQAVAGLLERHQSLRIRPITREILVHPGRDPGCYKTASALLELYVGSASRAAVVFDAAWEGRPSADSVEIEEMVDRQLQAKWGTDGKCIVIDPEIEGWVWSRSPHVDRVLGWQGRDPSLREWLAERDLWPEDAMKPPDPKAAFETCLREVHIKPSAAIFKELARRVGLRHCSDASFGRLVTTLQGWFPL